MTKILPYALVAVGGFAFGGVTCGSGGYVAGYYLSEPEIVRLDLQKDGLEGICVYKNNAELVCAADVNEDGAVDYAVIDEETYAVKELELGKDDCAKKYSRYLQRLQQQEQKRK